MALFNYVPKILLAARIVQNGLREEPRAKPVKDLCKKAHVAQKTGNGLVGAINAQGQFTNDALECGDQVDKYFP